MSTEIDRSTASLSEIIAYDVEQMEKSWASVRETLESRIERALNRLHYMQSGSMAIAPSAADIGRLIRTLEGEE